MRIYFIGLLILVFSTILYGQESSIKAKLDSSWSTLTDNTFFELIKENNLTFSLPEGFERTAVKKNYDVYYQYAIVHTKSNFEVRIFIKPFKGLFNEVSNFNPNKFSYNFLAIMSLEASGNVLPNIPQIDLFPKDAVKEEFNADWGATTAFVPNSDFGKGFNFCSLNCLRLDNVCEVYVFYMFDDVKNQQPLMKDVFYVVKFKK